MIIHAIAAKLKRRAKGAFKARHLEVSADRATRRVVPLIGHLQL